MLGAMFGRFVAPIRGWLAGLFVRPSVPFPLPIVIEPPAPAPPEPKLQRAKSKRAERTSGSYVYFDDILETIPRCRRMLRALRKVDEDAWDYHSRVGARLISSDGLASSVDLHERFKRDLPARGMVYMPLEGKKADRFDGCFMYFHRLKQMQPHFAAVRNDTRAVYRVSVAYHDEANKKRNIPWAYEFVVSIDDDVHIVSERQTRRIRFSQKPTKPTTYDAIVWDISKGLRAHYKVLSSTKGSATWDSAEQFGADLFRLAANFHDVTTTDFQVRATRDNATVAFSVGLKRTPYFFKDRQTGLAADGKRKRIFHAVEEHERTYPSGKVAIVPAHYRGERSFDWKGDRIVVSPPEQTVNRFSVPAIEYPHGEPVGPGWDSAKVGDLVVQVTERDVRKSA